MSNDPQDGLFGKFRAPKKAFRGLKVEAAALAIAASADIALVLGADGVIEDASLNVEGASEDDISALIGKAWADTVTGESVAKVNDAMAAAAASGHSSWHEINHEINGQEMLSIRYMVVSLNADRKFLALGRNLSETVQLQRMLVQAQQEMEREYARVRQAETRYRLLFQFSSEPVIIAEANTLRIRELNPAAQRVMQLDPARIEGKSFATGFASEYANEIAMLFAGARAAGTAEARGVKLAHGDEVVDLVATLFSFGRASHMLVKLIPHNQDILTDVKRSQLIDIVDAAPEAFVVTDYNGQVLAANPSFLELAQVTTLDSVEGHRLDRWIGRPGAEFSTLEHSVKNDGAARFFETTFRGLLGDTFDVEISGVAVSDSVPPCLGFVIRNTGGRLKSDVSVQTALPEAVEQMRDLVGRVPLKDLVRETTDIIERMCIEAALEISGDNRASAAEILGLSRQSLYVKLRRYGLDDHGSDANASGD